MGKKSKTRKNKNMNRNDNNKNKNKKILGKLVNDSILEENIQMLIGGKVGGSDENFVEPSELDKFLGYEKAVDVRGPLDKLNDYIKNSLSSITDVTSGLIARKLSDSVGMEGKTPEEIGEILKKDTEKLEKINDYLKTNDGEKMLDEVKELTTTASDIIGESVQKIPEDLDETMDKLAENAVNAGVGAMTDIPGVNVVVGTSKMISSLQGVAGETGEAVGKVAELIGNTAEKIKKPVNDIKDKIDEISDKIESVENFSPKIPQLQQPEILQTQQPEILQTHQPEIQPQLQQPEILQTQQPEIQPQSGGYNMNNVRNIIQTGGKKIRKRVNNTRHAFKNLVKNITRKNK